MHSQNLFADFNKKKLKDASEEAKDKQKHDQLEEANTIIKNDENFITKYNDFMKSINKEYDDDESKKLIEDDIKEASNEVNKEPIKRTMSTV